MPYDKEGKYYRIPTNSKNIINKRNKEKEFTKLKNNSTKEIKIKSLQNNLISYGNISLFLSLASVVLFFISLLGLVIFGQDEDSIGFYIFAILLMSPFLSILIAFGVGILGIFKDFGNRTRAFIGTIISIALLVILFALIITS